MITREDVARGRVFWSTMIDLDRAVARLRRVANPGPQTVGGVAFDALNNLRSDVERGVFKRNSLIAWVETVVTRTMRTVKTQAARVGTLVREKTRSPRARAGRPLRRTRTPGRGRVLREGDPRATQHAPHRTAARPAPRRRTERRARGAPPAPLLGRRLERSRADDDTTKMLLDALLEAPPRSPYFDQRLRKLTFAIWDLAGLSVCDLRLIVAQYEGGADAG